MPTRRSRAGAFKAKTKPNRLENAYQRWQERHETAGGDRQLTLKLGWAKGYSTAFTTARGTAVLNLVDGRIEVEVEGLEQPADVWLLVNRPGPHQTALPEEDDFLANLGTLSKVGNRYGLEAQVGAISDHPKADMIVVAAKGERPTVSRLLAGSKTLFQRRYTAERLGLSLPPVPCGEEPLSPTMAHASALVPSFDPLIELGADLFLNETFNGNGRTCGTCHPAENNTTIDPEFIATLPDNDPPFVAEFVPALMNNFEKPELMRKLGLILENTDGFGDLANSFTMRGVPHTLGMIVSLTPAPGGQFLAGNDSGGIGIQLEATQVVAVAAFLRVINSLDNIRSADKTADFTLSVNHFATARSLILLASAEVRDAIEVLDCGGLHPQAQKDLKKAAVFLDVASISVFQFSRNASIHLALGALDDALNELLL